MGKICVSFFAFISGYGLYKSYKNKKVSGLKWVLSREIKILGGFWIIAILAMIICQIADGRTAAVYFSDNTIKDGIGYMIIDLLGLAGTLHTPTLCSTWWYMSAAVIYVALVPLLVKLENKLYLVFLVAMILPRVINQYVLAKSNAISFFSAFLLGMIMSRYDLVNKWLKICNKGRKKIAKFAFMVIVMMVCYKFYATHSTIIFCELKWGIIPCIFILFFVEFITYIPRVRNFLIFLGKHSMNIYLVHTFIRAYYFRDFLYSFRYAPIIVVLLMGISVAISIVIEALKKLIRYDTLINKLCRAVENYSF
jgi:peptidoglycan/LPS O-acetylase OafA/YrhL